MRDKETPHPGRIVFVDAATGQIVDEAKASELPPEVCFVHTDDGWVPVVKFVLRREGRRRELLSYGPEEQLLASSTEVS
jgi:hypothetical protein